MSDIPPSSFVRNPDLVTADMDGDTVMMSVERGEYFGLGGVGARVWDLLAQPTPLSELVRQICAEYAVDASTCEADLKRFLGELMAQGLVTGA
jgi:Coenzyme PQQ synthesis protein D (PqqD)